MKRYNSQHVSKEKRGMSGHIIAGCVCLVVAIVTITVGITLAKMVSTASGSDSAQVAAFIVESRRDDTQTALEIDCSEEDKTASYTFAVTNTKEGKTAEVAITYDLIVTLPQALPNGLTMTLNGETGVASSNKTIYTFANMGQLPAGTEKINNYTLLFTADTNLVEEDYKFEKIQVSVHAEQVD